MDSVKIATCKIVQLSIRTYCFITNNIVVLLCEVLGFYTFLAFLSVSGCFVAYESIIRELHVKWCTHFRKFSFSEIFYTSCNSSCHSNMNIECHNSFDLTQLRYDTLAICQKKIGMIDLYLR